MSFSFQVTRSDRTENFLKKISRLELAKILTSQAQIGVRALAQYTPRDSGLSANSWSYEIIQNSRMITIGWKNSDVENGYPVALMIQYGHGTGTGGYVSGIDYINPAMRPVFDQIAETVWKAVISA